MDMYGADGNDEKCGEINFGLDYDFATQTLKLKIIQVLLKTNILYVINSWVLKKWLIEIELKLGIIQFSGKRLGSKRYKWLEWSLCSNNPASWQKTKIGHKN